MEENKHKKSKALIITIIVIILLLIFGYLIYKNRDVFGVKTSSTIAKIFSPLSPSDNSKKVIAEAGEDLKNGDGISVSGSNENNVPIVIKANNSNYGFTNQDIAFGELGEVTINGGNPNTFWSSFSSFLGNLINTNKTTPTPTPPAGGWAMDSNSDWSFNPNGTGGWVYNSTNGTWAPPGGIANPPAGGWVFNYNTGTWDFDSIGTGGWVYDTGTGSWVVPGGNNGSGGNGNNGNDIFPSVTVTASPISITSGGSSTISWTSTNTTTCDAGSGNGTGTQGSFSTGALTKGKSYAVTCTGTKGKGSGNAFVSVEGGINEFPTVTVTANPSSIASGESSTISWTSTNATTCDADSGNGTGVQGSFSTEVLTSNKMYSVTCTGTSGTGSGNAFVSVSGNISDGYPDLTTGTITPTSTTTKTATSISSIIYNNGGGSTGKSFSAFFTITDANNQSTESIATVQKLEARSQGLATITHTFPQVGKYSIRACVDKSSSLDAGTITELNNEGTGEDNNCGLWTTLTVTNSLALPEDCLSPKITDTDGKCINAGDCKSPKVVIGNKCEVDPNACLSPKVTDTATSECIDPGACKSPKVVNGNKCEIPPNLCKDIEDNPLTFTPEEKARLAVLLRKFYLVSSTLRTVDDISTTYNELDQQKNFISQIEDLTNQCYAQVDKIDKCINGHLVSNGNTCSGNGTLLGNNMMTSPLPLTTPATPTTPETYSFQSTWARHGNPWYSKDYATTAPAIGEPFPYTKDIEGYLKYEQLEPVNSINLVGAAAGEACKVVSGYYSGIMSKAAVFGPIQLGKAGADCDMFNKFPQYESCLENIDTKRFGGSLPDTIILDAGCKWEAGVDLQNTERILNIW